VICVTEAKPSGALEPALIVCVAETASLTRAFGACVTTPYRVRPERHKALIADRLLQRNAIDRLTIVARSAGGQSRQTAQ
jgi:hypothetical protein